MKVEGKKVNLLKKLREEGKINNEFESKLSSISLEDLIALKLELSSRDFGGKLFGLPLLQSVKEIVNDALLKFSLSASKTRKEGASLLGLSTKDYRQYLRKFNIGVQFEKKDN